MSRVLDREEGSQPISRVFPYPESKRALTVDSRAGECPGRGEARELERGDAGHDAYSGATGSAPRGPSVRTPSEGRMNTLPSRLSASWSPRDVAVPWKNRFLGRRRQKNCS